jgi:hypothetical protein
VLEKIKVDYKFSRDQINILGQELTAVLVGATKTANFINNITERLNIAEDVTRKIVDEIDKKLFSKIRASLEKVQSEEIKTEVTIPVTPTSKPEEVIDKNDVLAEIENPVPTKPIVSNPARKNVILDAQHNLPEQEKKILISSAAVPSRGPIMNNFKNSFGATSTVPVAPTIPTPIPVTPTMPAIPKISTSIPSTPTIPAAPKPIAQPTQPQPIQSPKPPQAPIPPAPSKYTVDPYREPLE